MRTSFHLAYHVRDLDEARAFYGTLLGCQEGRSTETWVDFDFFGIVEGGVVLIGGDPGIGKSTLLLQAMDALHRVGLPTLYVTGEASGAQAALRSRRLG